MVAAVRSLARLRRERVYFKGRLRNLPHGSGGRGRALFHPAFLAGQFPVGLDHHFD